MSTNAASCRRLSPDGSSFHHHKEQGAPTHLTGRHTHLLNPPEMVIELIQKGPTFQLWAGSVSSLPTTWHLKSASLSKNPLLRYILSEDARRFLKFPPAALACQFGYFLPEQLTPNNAGDPFQGQKSISCHIFKNKTPWGKLLCFSVF